MILLRTLLHKEVRVQALRQLKMAIKRERKVIWKAKYSMHWTRGNKCIE